MEKIKNRGKNIIFLIAIFQIVLFMCLTPAESYRIHQSNFSFGNGVIINKNKDFGDSVKEILGAGVNLLIGFLSINEIGFVSAATATTSCCPSTCSNVISTYTECSEKLIPTKCEYTSECKTGCCYDSIEGLCSTNSPKGECEADGGEWSSGTTCSMTKCTKGCCITGNNANFITDQQCTKLSQSKGVEKDFGQQIKTELACLAVVASNFEGACVLSGRSCKFESEKQCLYDGGTFHQDYLCSNSELDTKCTKQDSIKCVSGKNEIYWFDSCGNRENIYSSDKTASWNDGKVLAKADSCGGIGVIGSTSCGNCKNGLSTCSETLATGLHVSGGNFVCKDLGCKNAIANVGTKDRINGESWCLYDGAVGDGKSVVGSQYLRAYCYRGEVKIDMQGFKEYRNTICEEYTVTESGVTFTNAIYAPNLATTCIGITQTYYKKMTTGMNDDERNSIINEMATECGKYDTCMMKTVNIENDPFNSANYASQSTPYDFTNSFVFSMCVPRYPKGDDLKDGVDGNGCETASQSCKVIYESMGADNWKCVHNCDCTTAKFAQQMNDLCMSVGDCGSNVNIIGKGTDSVSISGKKGKLLNSTGGEREDTTGWYGGESDYQKLYEGKGVRVPSVYSWTNYIKNAKPVKGQTISVSTKEIAEEVAAILGKNIDLGTESNVDPEGLNTVLGWIGGISGASGGVLWQLSGMTVPATVAGAAPTAVLGTLAGPAMVAGFALMGIGLGGYLGNILGKSPGMVIALMTLGGIAGAGVGLLLSTALGIGGGTCSTGIGCIAGAIIIIIAVLIASFLLLFGVGDRETRIIEFKCQPWNPPSGGADCEECNGNALIPCTEYRCQSLGTLCNLINEDSESPECVSLARETNPPIISAGEVKTEGYKFNKEESKSVEVISRSNKGCINEFTPILFTLKTDEYAQCKYTFETPEDSTYDGMNGEETDEGMFERNHTFSLTIPNIDSEDVEMTEETTDSNGAIVKYGNLNMYVRCQDAQSPANQNIDLYQVKLCVRSGPDETIVNFNEVITTPENGATLKFGAVEQDVSLGINEPANCKYDITAGVSYDDMQYNMDCKTGINDKKTNGWPCTAKVSLVSGENKFYFKCKDMSGNTNTEDFVYTLTTSESELKIDSVNLIYGTKKIGFGEVLKAGLEPVSVDVEVKTSGGGYEGKSYCLWGVEEKGYRWMMSPFDEAVLVHNQILVKMGGYHNVYIDCEDEAGNEASTSGEFTLDIDNTPPAVIRAYKDGDKLKIVTNELARCYYNPITCIFDIDSTNANSMNPSFSTSHTAPWNPGIVYYIRCKDVFGNAGDCTKEISPS